MTVSIVVADDQPLVRSGIALILRAEKDFDVRAEAADGREAVDFARKLGADVVVMDLRMPVMDGVAATRELTADDPSDANQTHKVLVLTTFDGDEDVYAALRAGASGYLLKQAAPTDLIAAVRRIANGDSWIDPAVAGKVIAALARSPQVQLTDAKIGLLTPRERQVLTMMATGMTNAEIRDDLVLSDATVRTHVSRILMKTGSRDRAQAVVFAHRVGLVRWPSAGM